MRRLQRSTHGFEALRLLRLRLSGGQLLQKFQLLRELLNPKFTDSQQHYQYRQWLELLSRYKMGSPRPLDDNLKIATYGEWTPWQPRTTSTVVVQAYFYLESSEKDRRTTTVRPSFPIQPGHLAIIGKQEEEGVNYIKGMKKGQGRGKGGDNYPGRGQGKNKGKGGYNNKGKRARYNKGGEGCNYSPSSWSTSSLTYYNNNNYKNKGKGRGKGKGKSTTVNNSIQCHICKKLGHMAVNCWRKNTTTYETAAIGSGTPSQPQRFDLNHTTLDQPIACMPRDQLPTHNNREQCPTAHLR